MKVVTLAGLFGVALVAVLVTPIFSAPAPEAEASAMPTALALAMPEALAMPAPAPAGPNCMLLTYGVNPSEMGSLLNVMLDLSLSLLENEDDACKKQEIIKKMQKSRKDMNTWINKHDKKGKGLLNGLLGPLLTAVDQLLEGLLGSEGVLGAVGDLLSSVINLLTCLLKSLNLSVDLKLAVRLGNLLNLDLGVLLNLG